MLNTDDAIGCVSFCSLVVVCHSVVPGTTIFGTPGHLKDF